MSFNGKITTSPKVIFQHFFQTFVEEILHCREPLNAFAIDLVDQKQRNLILLCGSQIQKCIPLLLKMYEMEGWADIVTSKVKFLI
jgi:hypothetical protein